MSVPESLRFTYEDYARLPDDRRYEVIDGELYVTPAPTPYHQIVSRRIEVHVNTEKGFRRESVYAGDDVLRSPLLPGLEVALARVF
jgi:Uma2 family endonuclease